MQAPPVQAPAVETARRLGRELLDDMNADEIDGTVPDYAVLTGRLEAALGNLLDALDAQDGAR